MIGIHHLLLVLMIFSANSAELRMKSLTDTSILQLNTENIQKPTLGVLFKKDCVPCRKQIRNLDCLKENFSVFLIGAYSSEFSLREEYLKFKTDLPAYLANKELLDLLRLPSEATPVLLKFEKNSIATFIGFKECEAYKGIL